MTAKGREWIPIVPVPDDAPEPDFNHYKHGEPHPAHVFAYRDWSKRNQDGSAALLFYSCRFKSDKGEVALPLAFCHHVDDPDVRRWHWTSLPEPRPLFTPDEFRPGMRKLICGTERAALDAGLLLCEQFNVAAWTHGARSVKKADWSLFGPGDEVVIWPDCNCEREPVNKEEAAAGVKPESKPYLPAIKQPGIAAAETIAQILQARGCSVTIVDIPAPGEKPDGWNMSIALDLESAAWGKDATLKFIETHLRAPLPLGERGISTANLAAAGEWKQHLFLRDGMIRECRENVYQILMHHPDWEGCIGMDEFANAIKIMRDTPIGQKAGQLWDEDQDFKLGLWMAENLRLFVKSENVLAAGVRATAMENRFHPVRDWLDRLAWDGVPRLAGWLGEYAGVRETEYTALVGMLFMIGMVARIYRPGCKMDTALILEGLQGEGKSSIARALAGEWFSDTTFVMGDKDSFLALRGRWAYELAELDSFNRSESTRAKAFISSSTDSYRAPYDRTTKDWPRQCVFIGTTNQYEYFKDSSGNRRYWPVMCSDALNVEGLKAVREQLFAEAVYEFRESARWKFENGGPWWPTKDEQQRLFTPEQEMREVSDPWDVAIHHWLMNGTEREVTALDILVGALKMEVSKIDGARQATMRVGTCMRKLGWPKRRRTSGAREWYYERPASASVPAPAKVVVAGGDDDHPF